MARTHKRAQAAELVRPTGFVSREKNNPSKQKAIEFSHCNMGNEKSHMQAHDHLSLSPARVYRGEEANPDTTIAMRRKRPPVPGYLLSNRFGTYFLSSVRQKSSDSVQGSEMQV